jgi:fumarate hydratase subunit beta
MPSKITKSFNFGAIGRIAALMSQYVPKVEIVVPGDLGPEAIRRLTVKNFPLVIINDFQGNDYLLSFLAA